MAVWRSVTLTWRQPSSGAKHEQIGGAVALVFVIDTGRPPGLHRDRHARLSDKLLGSLIETHQHPVGIMRPCVDGEHVFHRSHEGAVGFRRDHPALPAMRFETVFLSVRPIVESLA